MNFDLYKKGNYMLNKNGIYMLIGRNKHYKNGLLHREDGPAVCWLDEYPDEWWYNGTKIKCGSLEEFRRIIKLLAFS